jgi:hypothetical protein
MLTEDKLEDARAKMHKMIDDATTVERVQEVVSALHLGHQMKGMVDAIHEATDALPKMVDDPDDYAPVAMNMVHHKASGDWFVITVRKASASEVEDFDDKLATAKEMPA